ncbi:MAG TPA: hypothetical protein VGI82_09035 [Chitinophagaceae bacterium]
MDSSNQLSDDLKNDDKAFLDAINMIIYRILHFFVSLHCKAEAMDDYNNRPHDVLSGLSPLEVLNGKIMDKNSLHSKMLLAKAERIKENRKAGCCSYSF